MVPNPPSSPAQGDDLIIGRRRFHSRLFTGTGKYPSMELMQQSIERSACEMVTVAVRRVQAVAAGHAGLMEAIDWTRIWMLPNTAGCTNAEEAVRVARLGRELAKLAGQEDNTFVKLEVIPDSRHLLPDPIGTLQACERGRTASAANASCRAVQWHGQGANKSQWHGRGSEGSRPARRQQPGLSGRAGAGAPGPYTTTGAARAPPSARSTVSGSRGSTSNAASLKPWASKPS